jgi:hypothetical protein
MPRYELPITPRKALLTLSLPLLLLPAKDRRMTQGRHQRQHTNHIAPATVERKTE